MKKSAAATRSSMSRTEARSSQVLAGLVRGTPSSFVTSSARSSRRWPATPFRTGRVPPSTRARCTRRSFWMFHGSGHRRSKPAVPRQQAVDGQIPVSRRQVCRRLCSAAHGTRTPRLATRISLLHARCGATPAASCSANVKDLPASSSGKGRGFLMAHSGHTQTVSFRLSTVGRRSAPAGASSMREVSGLTRSLSAEISRLGHKKARSGARCPCGGSSGGCGSPWVRAGPGSGCRIRRNRRGVPRRRSAGRSRAGRFSCRATA